MGMDPRAAVLQSAGISSPKAVMVMYEGRQRAVEAVERIRLAFPVIPIYARAKDIPHLLDLKEAGATDAILENAETSLQLGSKLLKGLGVMYDDLNFLSQLVRDSMELQAQTNIVPRDTDPDAMKPLQVRVTDLVATRKPVMALSGKGESVRISQQKRDRILMIQEELEETKIENEVPAGEDGRGVLYCELDTENDKR